MIPKFIEDAIEHLKPVFDQKFLTVTTRLDKIEGRLENIEKLLKERDK